jgi:hypothetical protein
VTRLFPVFPLFSPFPVTPLQCDQVTLSYARSDCSYATSLRHNEGHQVGARFDSRCRYATHYTTLVYATCVYPRYSTLAILVPNCSISGDAIAMQNDSSRKPSRNYRPWSWTIRPIRSLSRPHYPYPHEDEFELKERKHFEWYDSQSSIQKDLSASSQPKRPLSYPFAPEHLDISPDVSALSLDGGRVAWHHTLAGFLVYSTRRG